VLLMRMQDQYVIRNVLIGIGLLQFELQGIGQEESHNFI